MKSETISVHTGGRRSIVNITAEAAAFVGGGGGNLLLGTWQSIVLVDPNVDNPGRQIRFSFIAG